MRSIIGLLILLAAAPACADDADAAALSLADKIDKKAEQARDWQAFIEGAAGGAQTRTTTQQNQRLSFDLLIDKTLAKGWRAVLADRLDVNWQNQFGHRDEINTLKEAYLSWQPKDDFVADFGRINARYGVANGYNPTDYFRAGAVRSVVSVDPASLKKNRQGSVMLRGQTLWDNGSLTAAFSPKLESQTNDAPFHPNWGATNNQDRWLLVLSQKITEDINPQWLLYKEAKLPVQLGMNISMLINDSTIGYFEWSGGRSPSLLSQAFNSAGDTAFRNRLSTGATYTTSNKLSVTLEYQYNGSGLDQAGWNALRSGPLPIYGRYRQWVQTAQDMPTKHALFFYAGWQDAIINHLDLAAMVRVNSDDHSRLSWLEARYRWAHDEIALQWQRNSGSATSEYGAATQQQAWQIVLRHFF
ncbi:MAG: hypothetical protein HYS18_17240 [Burkholderiales bacterium]|nr:hypothetical protein [Burkholderiales bacterium]